MTVTSGEASSYQTPMIQLDGITKRFPGVLALDSVSFAVNAGEIHAVVGENGAGKSTLMNILAGELQPDAGEVLYQGQPRPDPQPVRCPTNWASTSSIRSWRCALI